MSYAVEVVTEGPERFRIVEVHMAGIQGPPGDTADLSGVLLIENNLSDLDSAGEARDNLDVYSSAEVDAAITAATVTDTDTGTGAVSGLGVAYSGSALTFNMSAGTARINGVSVPALAQSVSLAAADATNPRIDVFYLDDTGTFGRITGTPAVNPSQPAVDPTSQLYLGFALVPATATDLTSTTTTETIYAEGVEWTATEVGTGFTLNSLVNPQAGTKCIEATAVPAGDYVKFVDGSPSAFDPNGTLSLFIFSKAAWANKRSIALRWYNSGVAVGSSVTIKNGAFGFNSSNTSTYQQLIINKALFAIPAGASVDELRITAVGGSGAAIGFYLDTITTQSISAGSGGTTIIGLTQDQADARYLKLTGGTLTGDLIVPAEAYGAGWNGDNSAPTKNDVYDKIEAVVAGVPGTYTDEMAQDAVGAMVDGTLSYVDATPTLGVNTTAEAERIRDVIGTALVAGTNITITPNDGSDTITIDAAGGAVYTSENARDDIAAALVAGTNITITPNDGADTITIDATGSYTDGDATDAVLTNLIKYWKSAGSTAPSFIGLVRSVISGTTYAAPTSTNLRTRRDRLMFQTASGAGAQAGETENGSARSLWPVDGYSATLEWSQSAANAGYRSFAGFCTSTSPGNVEPSTLVNMCGFGADAADTNIQFMHNDASGTATKVDTGIPKNVAGLFLRGTIVIAAGGASIAYTLQRLDAAGSDSDTVSTNLPVTTTPQGYIFWCGNGAIANNADIEIHRFWVTGV